MAIGNRKPKAVHHRFGKLKAQCGAKLRQFDDFASNSLARVTCKKCLAKAAKKEADERFKRNVEHFFNSMKRED